jgi:hypothetical protein
MMNHSTPVQSPEKGGDLHIPFPLSTILTEETRRFAENRYH